jgi:predicted dehydrogenase
MMKQYRAGIIGSGFVGVAHAEALRRLGFVDVIAMADNCNSEEKAAIMHIPNHYCDYRVMIDEMKLDVVHICTPNNTHKEMALYAFENGVHVVCEKPLCCTLDDAHIMYEAAEKSGLVHAVNFNNRFYPMTREMKQMVRKNDLGEIFTIHGGYIQDWLLYDTDYNWRLHSSESGKTRVAADLGSHWMDLVQFITGLEIVEVFAEFKTAYTTRKKPSKPVEAFSKETFKPEDYQSFLIDTEDAAVVLLRFNNGAIGSMIVSQIFAGKKNKLNVLIAGSKKSLEWDLDNLENIIIGSKDRANDILTKDMSLVNKEAAGLISYPAGHAEGYPDAFKQCFKQVYNYIADRNSIKDLNFV